MTRLNLIALTPILPLGKHHSAPSEMVSGYGQLFAQSVALRAVLQIAQRVKVNIKEILINGGLAERRMMKMGDNPNKLEDEDPSLGWVDFWKELHREENPPDLPSPSDPRLAEFKPHELVQITPSELEAVRYVMTEMGYAKTTIRISAGKVAKIIRYLKNGGRL